MRTRNRSFSFVHVPLPCGAGRGRDLLSACARRTLRPFPSLVGDLFTNSQFDSKTKISPLPPAERSPMRRSDKGP